MAWVARTARWFSSQSLGYLFGKFVEGIWALVIGGQTPGPLAGFFALLAYMQNLGWLGVAFCAFGGLALGLVIEAASRASNFYSAHAAPSPAQPSGAMWFASDGFLWRITRKGYDAMTLGVTSPTHDHMLGPNCPKCRRDLLLRIGSEIQVMETLDVPCRTCEWTPSGAVNARTARLFAYKAAQQKLLNLELPWKPDQ